MRGGFSIRLAILEVRKHSKSLIHLPLPARRATVRKNGRRRRHIEGSGDPARKLVSNRADVRLRETQIRRFVQCNTTGRKQSGGIMLRQPVRQAGVEDGIRLTSALSAFLDCSLLLLQVTGFQPVGRPGRRGQGPGRGGRRHRETRDARLSGPCCRLP